MGEWHDIADHSLVNLKQVCAQARGDRMRCVADGSLLVFKHHRVPIRQQKVSDLPACVEDVDQLSGFHPQRRATYLNRAARVSLGFPNCREKSEGSFMAS